MSVETCGHQDQVGLVALDSGQPVSFYRSAKFGASRALRQWGQHDMVPADIVKPSGIEGVLEAGADHDFGPVQENLDRAVAMVHIEIEDGDASSTLGQRTFGGQRDIVEQAKTHGNRGFRVVARWPYRTEGPLCLSGQHRVHPLYGSTRSQAGGA